MLAAEAFYYSLGFTISPPAGIIYEHLKMFGRLLRGYRSPVVALLAVTLASVLPAAAAVVSGAVKDPSGNGVPGTQITISGASLIQALEVHSTESGTFETPDLAPGTYQFRFSHPGFQDTIRTVTVGDTAAPINVALQLAVQNQSVTVSAAPSKYINSDPLYQTLRQIGLGRSFSIGESSLDIDVAHFVFHSGTLRFLQPVQNRVTGAVFIGSGHLTLTPFNKLDRDELRRRAGSEVLEEDFTQIVFRFTNDASRELLHLAPHPCEPDPAAGAVFADWEQRVRHRRDQAIGETESILNNEAMDNVDADVLASLYNPGRPPFFNAYIKGRKHHDLRFYVRFRGGAIPQLDSPEEVALVNFAYDSLDDGIWYMQHLKSEWDRNSASSSEDRRFFAVHKYTIDAYITGNNHLAGIAKLDLEALIPGERVIKFHLLPNLRVSRVTDGRGKDLYAVQQSPKEDGSFYVILDSPAQVRAPFVLQIEYAGDKVITDAGGGSYYVGARECWYPTPNQFNERSMYDLTFHVPKHKKIISVGKLEKEWAEGQYAASHWVTASPIAIAGFNYGDYKVEQLNDSKVGTAMSGYYLPNLPDRLRKYDAVQSLAPAAMTKHILEITRAQIQLCNYYFGPDGFDHIYITEQPNFSFGQSWPNLVYMPISAYIDSTQRWMLFGGINNQFTAFVQEVAPHEVAHQWWGHAVGWASYHDQWLSEGFAEFSAALFLQNAQGPGWENDYRTFWERLRHRILDRGHFGAAPNDAGPIWLGERLTSPRNPVAYQDVVYAKGAYVLAMLRSIMYTNKDRDKNFITMMHDFVETHKDHAASTESFRAVVQKHMTPVMDLAHNGSMDWFFKEWVYETELPKYQFTYQVTPIANGHSKVSMTLTQTGVSDSFVMAVPVFIELKKKWVRIGQIPVTGNHSQTVDTELPVVPASVKIDAFNEILQR